MINITACMIQTHFFKITQNATALFNTALYFIVAVVIGNPLHSNSKMSKYVF